MTVIATPTLYTNPVTVDPGTGAGLGGLGPGGIVTPEAVRLFLLDRPECNILTAGEIEYIGLHIEQGVMAACSEFNIIAPLTHRLKLDGSDWPELCPHLLILGTAAWLQKGMASKQLRNQFNAQDGNMPRVGIHDKYPMYLQFAQSLQAEFRDGVSRYKQLSDQEQAYRISRSPMSRRGGRWF